MVAEIISLGILSLPAGIATLGYTTYGRNFPSILP